MAQRKILIPVDGSVASTRAFERHLDSLQKKGNMVYIVDVADKTQILGQWHLDGLRNGVDMVYIVHVPEYTDSIGLPGADVGLMARRPVGKEEGERFKDKLYKYTEELHSLQVSPNIQSLERGGEPGEQIVNLAIDKTASWIIMGCGHLDTNPRGMLGSISNYVTDNAPPNCNVITS